MKNVPLPVMLAMTWLAAKVILFYTGWLGDTFQAGVFLNLLFLVVLIYAAIRRTKAGGSFFDLLRAAMRPAAMYIVLVSAFIFCYYRFLDTGFMEYRLEEVMKGMEKAVVDAGGYEAFRSEDPTITQPDEESFLADRREQLGNFIFSPFAQTSLSLLALTVTAFIYSLMMTAFFRFMAARLQR